MNKATNENSSKSLSIIIKIILSFLSISLPFLVYYFSSLELYAYHELFKIDFSFFNNSVTEIKVWNSLILFVYLLSHSNYTVLFYICIMVLLAMLPIAVTNWFINDNEFRKSKISFVGYTIVVISYFIILIVLMQVFQISDIFIYEIRNKYLSENIQYCQIIKGNSHEELTIMENSSVPYKLLLKESSIQYYKPDEGNLLWKNFNESEIRSMKQLCDDYNNSLK